jgi:hypothetical protein
MIILCLEKQPPIRYNKPRRQLKKSVHADERPLREDVPSDFAGIPSRRHRTSR